MKASPFDKCTPQISLFYSSDEAYLIMVSQFDIIYIYQLSGIGRNSTFIFYDALPVEGAIHAHPFIHHSGLYMAIGRHGMNGDVVSSREPFIMEAVIRGAGKLFIIY